MPGHFISGQGSLIVAGTFNIKVTPNNSAINKFTNLKNQVEIVKNWRSGGTRVPLEVQNGPAIGSLHSTIRVPLDYH